MDISPGSSGGAVVDYRGTVCGIATYFEVRKLVLKDGRLVNDPSQILKFGVSSEVFRKATATAHTLQPIPLRPIALRARQMDALCELGSMIEFVDLVLSDIAAVTERTTIVEYKMYPVYDAQYNAYRWGGGAQVVGRLPLQSAYDRIALAKSFLDPFLSKSRQTPLTISVANLFSDSLKHAKLSVAILHGLEGKPPTKAREEHLRSIDLHNLAVGTLKAARAEIIRGMKTDSRHCDRAALNFVSRSKVETPTQALRVIE
jgi:hypothetical protein